MIANNEIKVTHVRSREKDVTATDRRVVISQSEPSTGLLCVIFTGEGEGGGGGGG